MRAEHLRYIWWVCEATWRFIYLFDQVTGSLPHSSQQPLPAKALGGKVTIYKKQRSFEQSSEHIFFSHKSFVTFQAVSERTCIQSTQGRGQCNLTRWFLPHPWCFWSHSVLSKGHIQENILNIIFFYKLYIPKISKVQMTNKNMDIWLYIYIYTYKIPLWRCMRAPSTKAGEIVSLAA